MVAPARGRLLALVGGMGTRRHRTGDQAHDDQRSGGTDVAPGKRTLTSSLPPPRDIASFDHVGEYREARATIDGTPTTSRLTDRQLRRACERNLHWQQKLGFSTSLFGGGDIDSGEFADNVAEKQTSLGLPVDGIAGPSTLGAVIRGTSGPDDPFAMHLIGMTQGASQKQSSGHGGARSRKPAAKPAAKPPTETRLRAEVTDVQPTDDGVQVVVGAGANHGIDASWHVHILGCNLDWQVGDVRANSIVAISRRGRVDDVVGLDVVDLKGVPRESPAEEAEAEAAADAAAAGGTDEPAWWTFED